ncbi:ABC transporter [Colletotrichum plurivorum]|uniref:ABC transporter n=1 Tax=Colletotrichum plurivorum TaxID=2175906 RepID=A0A8H6JPP7_9PEZI|nr:ABC transporter [Colletotrichum plurivorum]
MRGPSECINDNSFGPSVQGCRDDFDFTLRFEHIFLSILPSVIFIALSIPRGVSLLRKPALVGGVLLRVSKVVAFAIYAIFALVVLVLSTVGPAQFTTLFVASAALRFTAALFMSAISYWEHSRSPRPSVLLNAFLFLSTLFDATQARSLWLSVSAQHEAAVARVFVASTAWKAALILLECWHKTSWLGWDQKSHSPEETTGLYGLASFFWLNPLFKTGYKKVLAVPDLFALDRNMSADAMQQSFAPTVEPTRLEGRKHALGRELASHLAVPLLLPVAPRITLVGLVFCQPFLIEALLNHLADPENKKATANRGYGLIGATVLVYTAIPFATALYWYFQERFLCMMRACLATALYRKTVRSPASASDDSAALTLMSADVERIRMGFVQFHEFWANPVQVALACWLLQRQLGAAFVAPLIVVACCVASSTILMRRIAPRQMAWMAAIQKRVGQTANVIGNMKNLKISGLSGPVEDSIRDLRASEVEAGGKFRRFLVGSATIGFTPVLLAPVFTLATTSRDLDVTTIFTSISYLLLLSEPLTTLFQITPHLLAGFACLQRVQDYLQKESRHDFREFPEKQGPRSSASVDVVNASFGWNSGSFVLKNISVSIPAGFTIVVGPVASGKSTLCKALLGETPAVQGQVVMRSSPRAVGYCDQTAFLWNESIKDNIIGLSKFVDEKRYNEVIEATMLNPDLRVLPEGDQTTVGSKGISLSGGQKMRISLARALYQQCDLLIVDDVLGGLDADTEEYVFQRVFGSSGLLKARGTTAVLCTHATRHLSSSDYVIALADNGTIAEHGTFDDLARIRPSIIQKFGAQPRPKGAKASAESAHAEAPDAASDAPASRASSTASLRDDTSPDPTRIMGDRAVFGYYFRSIGTFWMLAFSAFGVSCGFFNNFPAVWLKFWSEDVSSADPSRSKSFYVGLYALFQSLALGSLVCEAIIGLLVIIRISGTNLHKAALRTLFAAPLRFFTTTDTGVVTNLFSQDMTLIDGELPQALINTSLQTWIGIGSAAVVATSSPYVAIAYPFIGGLLYCIQRFYLRTSRQLRLLDLEAKSPLYTNFLDTIGGVATIRAFGWSEDAVRQNNALLDTSQRPAYLLSLIQRWLAFVLGMVVAVLALSVVTLSTQLRSNAGFAGASMVSLMSFGKILANLVQMYTQLETSIGAVGRLKSFSDATPREQMDGDHWAVPASWPESGKIEVKGVSASYRPQSLSNNRDGDYAKLESRDDLALRNLTLSIEPGQKVALCGRTGSGKSSVVLLLLRLLDPLPSSTTNMFIDGHPLHAVDRDTLRRRLIAVPQDAVFLPEGTSFKMNLDPFGVATDEEYQAVLESVRLWGLVSDNGGLDAGMNADMLSQGQKQLFSLSRAVLRRRTLSRTRALATRTAEARPASGSRAGVELRSIPQSAEGGVLILDECTSGVDRETEKMMQDIIQREFESYTILMVSHRLDMVMNFVDKVLVMDSGRLVEQGVPTELVKSENSRFRHLWTLSGLDSQ